ncbi:hypothetical protein [Roseococcus thiosulfatophilus]|uniref:hypothetical protein n=1 Tax=Roseococcus thiosulfatophilus TaxID=35813 RepID=UPI001A8D0A1A|nr:hypothetical protein [Roseococcus thiosulfatophilus]
MRNATRWMPALVVATGLALAGGAAAQKQPDPPPAAGGKGGPAAGAQSQKLHLTPPPPIGQAPRPQPRQAQPAPTQPHQAQPRQGQPGTGPQASQKLHLTPPPPIGQAQPRAPQPQPQPRQAQPQQRPAQPGTGPQASQKLHLTPPSIPPDNRGPRPGSRTPNEREAQRREPNPSWPALPPRMDNEPAALATLRQLLSDDVQLGYAEARQEGEVLTLRDADLRRGAERLLVQELILEAPGTEGLRRGEARNLRLEAPEAAVTMERLEIGGLAMLPLRPGQEPGEREPDQIALESLRFSGLEVRERSGTRVTLARFDLSGWRAGQAGRAGLEGLEVGLSGAPVDQVRVASASMEGHDIAALMTSAVRNEAPSRPPAGRQAYRVEGVQVLRGGQGVAGMGRLLIEGEAREDGFSGGRIAVNEVVVERTPETAVVLDVVGLDRLSMDLTIDASWTPANERLDVSAFAFGVRDLGALALGWSMEGVNIENPGASPEAVRLLQAQLRYADQSLYERTLADQARRQNMTPAQVRDQHREMVTAALTGPRPDPALDGLREALLRFVAGQAREVEIIARPPAPVTLDAAQAAMAQGPAAAIALLGVRATAR